jgi:hypothetical protein
MRPVAFAALLVLAACENENVLQTTVVWMD